MTEPKSGAKPKRKTVAKPKSAPRADAKTTTEAESPPPASAPKGFELLSRDQRKALETLSLNLARAALTAQGAIAEAALRQAETPAALSADPLHVGAALGEVMGRLAAQPDRLMRAQTDLFGRYMELWRSAAQTASGQTSAPIAAR